MLGKDLLVFDTNATDSSDNVGAYLRASDGTLITHTTVSGKEALDVNIANSIAVEADLDGIYDGIENPAPDNVGLIGFQRDADPGLEDQTITFTGANPNADALNPANIFAQDTNSFLHGWNGTAWDRAEIQSGALKVFAEIDDPIEVFGNVADDAADAGNPVKMGSRAVSGALTAIDANDRADAISDLYRRMWVNDSANISLNNESVSVGSATPTELVVSPLAGRKKIIVQNTGNQAVYIGDDQVDASSGLSVGARGSLTLELGPDVSLYAIAGAGTQDIRILEVA